MANRKYYSILERYDGKWYPQFGDYNRSTVEFERRCFISSGTSKQDLKIILTEPEQTAIDAAVNQLNKSK